MSKITTDRRARAISRVSKNIKGDAARPRIRVFRSNKYIYAQAIDDSKGGHIIASVSSLTLKKQAKDEKTKKADMSKNIGEALGNQLLKKGIKKALFDRSRYAYHGRVQKLAEGVRSSGVVI